LSPPRIIVPVPTFTSAPPAAPRLLHSEPPKPQSLMTPLTVVLRLLPPTVSWLAPR
jgi:hypothetical protein